MLLKMKSTLRPGAMAFAVLATLAAPAPSAPVEPRDVLAGHRLTALDGAAVSLSAYRGEVVVVNFWASWCAPCRGELPVMDRWNTAWSGRGARVVAISIDRDVRNARRFAREMNLSLTVLHDGPDGLARTLDIPTVPYTVLLDRDGNVLGTLHGSAEGELAALESRVETLLAGRRDAPVQKAGMNAEGGAR